MEKIRICVACKEPKDIEEFHRSGNGNGRKKTCKLCLNSSNRAEKPLSIYEVIMIHKSKFNLGYPRYLASDDFKSFRI